MINYHNFIVITSLRAGTGEERPKTYAKTLGSTGFGSATIACYELVASRVDRYVSRVSRNTGKQESNPNLSGAIFFGAFVADSYKSRVVNCSTPPPY